MKIQQIFVKEKCSVNQLTKHKKCGGNCSSRYGIK